MFFHASFRLRVVPFDRRAPLITSHKNQPPIFDFISPEALNYTPLDLGEQDPKNSLTAGINALSGSNKELMIKILQILLLLVAIKLHRS